MRSGWIVLVLAVMGCAPPKAPSKHDELVAKAREAREQREAAMMARHKAYQGALAERRRGMQQAVDDLPKRREEQRAQQLAELEARCASNREERMAELEAYLERRDKVIELQEWEVKHCKMVDRSKPIVRRVQDAFGEYHWIEGRDRGVERECDQTPPERIRTTWASRLSPGQPPHRPEAMDCRALDIRASETAAEYWRKD